MTGDYTLTLPVMLAVAIATATSRALSYGTIYTTKLLRRGTDIDRTPSADPFEDLTAADAMHPFAAPLTIAPQPPGLPGPDRAPLPGPVTHRHHPQVLFASESLTQALRQLELYGHDGLPVISDDGQHLQGWITSQNVLQAVARHMHTTPPSRAAHPPHGLTARGRSPRAADPAARLPDPGDHHPRQLARRRQALGDTSWPPGWVPVSVLDNHTLRDPDPGITLAAGDRDQPARSPNHATQNPHTPPASPAISQTASPQMRGRALARCGAAAARAARARLPRPARVVAGAVRALLSNFRSSWRPLRQSRKTRRPETRPSACARAAASG